MKKLLAVLLLFLTGLIYAEGPRQGEVSKSVKQPVDFNSNAVYQASFTCATSQLQSVFISSPFPAGLYQIKVSSPGQGGAYFEVYDGAASTGDAASGSFPARLVDRVNAMLNRDHFYSVSFSSWLAVSNQAPVGGTPACLCIIYRVR